MKRQASSQSASRSKKKQKDASTPRRPLSAYNIYFKLVRPVLIETHERGEKQPDFDTHLENAIKSGKTKAQGALFQAASRTLAERWKDMSPTERHPFEEQAQEEMKKYKIQLGAFEMKKAMEEKSQKSNGIKLKEAPKRTPSSSASGNDGSSSARTSTKGVVMPQQSNLSDSEATTISSKSDPSNKQGKVFVQQSSGVFMNNNSSNNNNSNNYYNNSSCYSESAPLFQGLELNTPNVVGSSDADSLVKNNNNNHNFTNQSSPSDLLTGAIVSMLMNQLANGGNVNNNNNNNNVALDLMQNIAANALMESLASDPTALLLLVILLLQANNNSNTTSSQPAPPTTNAPAPNPTAALLASLLQNNNNISGAGSFNPIQVQPTQDSQPAINIANLLTMNTNQQFPSNTPNVIQSSSPPNQADLLEKLSQLSEGERELLRSLVENKVMDLSQSPV